MNRSRIKNHEGLLALNFLAILVCTVSLSACKLFASKSSSSSSSSSNSSNSSSSSSGACVPPSGTAHVSTLAGGPLGHDDGIGTSASFSAASSLAVDSAGNIFAVDSNNNEIRKVTPSGVVTTFAGSRTSGFSDGTGTDARFNNPFGIAIDPVGNLFVGDMQNHRIRKITPSGIVTTFAGSGSNTSTDGNGTAAGLAYPYPTAIDDSGNLIVSDEQQHNSIIRKIDSSGNVTTLGDTHTYHPFYFFFGAIVAGNLFAPAYDDSVVLKITDSGAISVFAGIGIDSEADGTGVAAYFSGPNGIAADCAGNLYVSDLSGYTIRKVTPDGVVTTVAGAGTQGQNDGDGTHAKFVGPQGLAFDSSGNLYVADSFNTNAIRKISFY